MFQAPLSNPHSTTAAGQDGMQRKATTPNHVKAEASAEGNETQHEADGAGAKKTSTAAAVAAKAPAKTAKAATKSTKAPAGKAKHKGERGEFLDGQRQMLLDERATYIRSAESLKAQADSLALEHEPGDVQFDEEGGEGGTANVDREMDLHLSAQARATVVEIDRALAKIEDGTYGLCEQCGDTIPEARLQALPHAALCVTCKSGGLSSRR
jgi:DnaK suppressor protein